jgi:hypothetical protein
MQDVFPECSIIGTGGGQELIFNCSKVSLFADAAFSYSWGRIWCFNSQLVALIRILYVSKCKPKFIEMFIWLWMPVPIEYICILIRIIAYKCKHALHIFPEPAAEIFGNSRLLVFIFDQPR